jgi:hypothetical protein
VRRGSRIPGTVLLLCALQAAGCASPASVATPGPPLTVRYTTDRPADAQAYAGSDSCRSCHAVIALFWSGTAHAGSMRSLEAADRARETACLRCHATGFGILSGYTVGGGPSDLAAVGCEACHGPAAGHVADPRGVRPSGSLFAGCPPCLVNEVCRRCHTPAWSPDFTPAATFDKVICPKQQ